jgi:hypothetical protein
MAPCHGGKPPGLFRFREQFDDFVKAPFDSAPQSNGSADDDPASVLRDVSLSVLLRTSIFKRHQVLAAWDSDQCCTVTRHRGGAVTAAGRCNVIALSPRPPLRVAHINALSVRADRALDVRPDVWLVKRVEPLR